MKTLPDPLLFTDGHRVRSREDWPSRRDELKKLFEREVYGPLPPAPISIEVETKSVTPKTVATTQLGAARPEVRAVTRELALTIHLANGNTLPLVVHFTAPDSPGPHAVIVRADITHAPKPWGELKPDQLHAILDRGYAVADFERAALSPDTKDRKGGLFDLMPESPDTGTLMAWAWGYSRVIDALLQEKLIDPNAIVVTGHSRVGKAALLAGAFDDRVTITAPAGSGAGGAGCWRYLYGKVESLKAAEKYAPQWFVRDFGKYADAVETLPVDQHELKALVAPRALISCEGLGDTWCNPQGSLLTHVAAKEVYTFLGVPEKIGVHFREGGHMQSAEDWDALLDFADWQLKGKPTATKFDERPMEVDESAFPWARDLR